MQEGVRPGSICWVLQTAAGRGTGSKGGTQACLAGNAGLPPAVASRPCLRTHCDRCKPAVRCREHASRGGLLQAAAAAAPPAARASRAAEPVAAGAGQLEAFGARLRPPCAGGRGCRAAKQRARVCRRLAQRALRPCGLPNYRVSKRDVAWSA